MIHKNVEDLMYVTDLKYLIMILFILVGLKFRKQCMKNKDNVSSNDSVRSVWYEGNEFLFVFEEATQIFVFVQI